MYSYERPYMMVLDAYVKIFLRWSPRNNSTPSWYLQMQSKQKLKKVKSHELARLWSLCSVANRRSEGGHVFVMCWDRN